MSELPAIDKTGLEVISPDCTRRFVFLTVSPFCIGRGESGNHLQLADSRISRQCAALISEGDLWYLEDRGHRRGVFVSGKQIDRCELKDGDIKPACVQSCSAKALVFQISNSPSIFERAPLCATSSSYGKRDCG